MSKTYKGWEILKMTEEGKFKEGNRIIRSEIEEYTFKSETWLDEDENEAKISEFMETTYTIQPHLVSFIEALNSGKNCWVEHPYIDWSCYPDNDVSIKIYTKLCFNKLVRHSPQPIKDVLYILGWKCSNNSLFMEIIHNGEWYIEN